jgi:HEAT repeat protein
VKLLVIAFFGIIILPQSSLALVMNPFIFPVKNADARAEEEEEDEAFARTFRQGRDLIDKEDWAKAAEKFKEVIAKYPDNKSTDAALYWLAFCYKKQKQFKETEAALDRLLKDFPTSSWADDARVMKLEIAVPLGKMVFPNFGGSTMISPPGVYTKTAPGSLTHPATTIMRTTAPETFEGFRTYGELNTETKTPLDREDEIKLAAFQSLLAADAKKGFDTLNEILKPSSKASETLRLEALRAVRRPRLLNNFYSKHITAMTMMNTAAGDNKELVSMLRETLLKSFRNEANIKIRKEIIYTLASMNDEQSANYLGELYSAENDREVKKAIINGFGTRWGINGFSLAHVPGSTSVQTSKMNTAAGAVNQTQKIEFAKLLEIVRAEKDSELRSLALSHLRRFGGWETNGQIVEVLSEIYDAETNEDFKKSLVQSLGKIKQPQALKKLMNIAKNDKSDKFRLEAIYALRDNNSPEAVKFLEELIK